MNKKMMLSLAAAAMVGTLAVGGTLAWFTDTETATNVVTTGKVDITLNENGGKDGVASKDGLTYENVLPGDKFQKKVTIQNVENDAYVRAKIIISGSKTILGTFDDKFENNEIKFLKGEGKAAEELALNWSKNDEDGTWMATVEYPENGGIMKMPVGEEKVEWTVFDLISIPGAEWDNAFTKQTMNVQVVAEAVQSKNFDNAADAWGQAGDVSAASQAADDKIGTIEPTKASGDNQ